MSRLSRAFDMYMNPDKYIIKEKKAPPPTVESGPIDPNYPRREYRLVQVAGNQQFKLQYKEQAAEGWTDYKEGYYSSRQSYIKTDKREVMERIAKDVAMSHYQWWKNQQGVGTIIDLGKLP